jgi:UDP-glucose 4-epimerase
MKTIIITGVAGFLGRYVAREFSVRNWNVIGLDTIDTENAPMLDLMKYYKMRLPSAGLIEVVQEHLPHLCVHCAGRSSVELSIQEPLADFTACLNVTSHLLDILRTYAPECKTLFFSSAAVYGSPNKLPVSEDHPLKPISPYGYHKQMAELLCQEYYKIYNLPTAIFRIFSAYGPGLRRQVIWDFCRKALFESKLHIVGTGSETRDFIHARDIARAVYIAAEKSPFAGNIYNIGSGKATTIMDLGSMILKYIGQEKPITVNRKTPFGVPIKWRADIEKISQIGFTPEIKFETGIERYVKWFCIEMASNE